MKIGVTSENRLKVNAVINAYSFMKPSLEVIGCSTTSGVGEQPVNEQTLLGAKNRIADVSNRVDGLDRIISIENGIFQEDGRWLDKAVVVIYDTHQKKNMLHIRMQLFFQINMLKEHVK